MSAHYPTLFGCPSGGGGDVVVAGLRYDRGTTTVPGCAAAPAVLRELSGGAPIHGRRLFDLATGKPVLEGARLSDIGDLRFRASESDDDYLAFVANAVEVIAKEGKKPLLLGGDHLLTLPILRGMAGAGRTVQVIQLDAHHDYRDVGPRERPTHATFVSFLAKEKLAARILQVGVRGFATEIPRAIAGVEQVAVEAVAAALVPDVDVYLTVDTDAFDPTIAPAVGYPVPGGLGYEALGAVLRGVRARGLSIVGADWTEYNPTFDTAHRLTGRHILHGLVQLTAAMLEGVVR